MQTYRRVLLTIFSLIALVCSQTTNSTELTYSSALSDAQLKSALSEFPNAKVWVVSMYEGHIHKNGSVKVKLPADTISKVIYLTSYEQINWSFDQIEKCNVKAIIVCSYASKSSIYLSAIGSSKAFRVNTYWSNSGQPEFKNTGFISLRNFIEDNLNLNIETLSIKYGGSEINVPYDTVNCTFSIISKSNALSTDSLAKILAKYNGMNSHFITVNKGFEGNTSVTFIEDTTPKVLVLSSKDKTNWILKNPAKANLKAIITTASSTSTKVSDMGDIPVYRTLASLPAFDNVESESFLKVKQYINDSLNLRLTGYSFGNPWWSEVGSITSPQQYVTSLSVVKTNTTGNQFYYIGKNTITCTQSSTIYLYTVNGKEISHLYTPAGETVRFVVTTPGIYLLKIESRSQQHTLRVHMQ